MTDAGLEFAPLAVELFVPDVSEAVGFYTEKLGFRLVRSDTGLDGAITFALTALGSAVFMFMSDAYYAGPSQHLTSGRGECVDIRVMVDDVDAMHASTLTAGLTVLHPIADREYGLRDFIVRDPWGFRLRFASPLR